MHIYASRSVLTATLVLLATLPRPASAEGAWIRPADPVPLSGPLFEEWKHMTFLPVDSIPQLTGPEQEAAYAADVDRRVGKLNETPHLRKGFDLRKPVKEATLTVSAIGFVETSLNGEKVGDHEMSPNVRQYRELANEVEYDVTAMLQEGENAIGLVIADGWFRETMAWDLSGDPRLPGGPLARAELEVQFEDGTWNVIRTDESWAAGTGPVVVNTQYGGELHDLTRAEDWDTPGFDASGWGEVEVVEVPFIDVVAEEAPPQREIRRVKPVNMSEPRPGVYVFELGETITGFPELRLPAGQTGTVFLRPSEYTWNADIPEGWHHRTNYPGEEVAPEPVPGVIVAKRRSSSFMADVRGVPHRGPIGQMTWMVKPPAGGQAATFRPKFAITVMRYVEVVGLDTPPTVDDLDLVVIHNDIPRTDSFETSDAVLNGIYEAAARSTLMNTQSMSWDNATERNQTTWPWTWPAPFVTGLGDWSGLYGKFLTDQEVWVLPNGKTSGQTLSDRSVHYRGAVTPLHETPAVDLAWVIQQRYGDMDRIRSYYPTIPRFIDHYWAGEKGEKYLAGIRDWDPEGTGGYGKPWVQDPDAPSTNSGDHIEGPASTLLDYEPISPKLFVTACHWVDVIQKASIIADSLGKTADRDRYAALAADIRSALRGSAVRDPETGAFGAVRNKKTGEITTHAGNPIANAMAVTWGLVDEDEAQELADLTWEDMKERHGGHIIGGREWRNTLYLLSLYGHLDDATAWMKTTEFPAIGYFTEDLGWGTIPEVRRPAQGGAVWDSTMQAESHSFANWFPEILAGYRADESQPGMQHFILDPHFTSELDFVRYTTRNPYGEVRSAWERDGSGMTWEIEIPADSTAEVHVPAGAEVSSDDAEAPALDDSGVATFPAGTFTFKWTPSDG